MEIAVILFVFERLRTGSACKLAYRQMRARKLIQRDKIRRIFQQFLLDGSFPFDDAVAEFFLSVEFGGIDFLEHLFVLAEEIATFFSILIGHFKLQHRIVLFLPVDGSIEWIEFVLSFKI